MAARKSVGPGGLAGLAGLQRGGGASAYGANKLTAHRLELLETSFSAYADEDSGKVKHEDLEKVLAASLTRYLEREIDDIIGEHDEDAELQLVDLKTVVQQRQPFINKSWHEIIASRDKQSGIKPVESVDADDLFHQLYESHKMLVDSSSGQDGSLDVHNLEYILSTCGEEVDHDDFDTLLDKIKHPRKGNFDMRLLLMYLAGLMEDVGIGGSEELAKAACKRIEDISKEKQKRGKAGAARPGPTEGQLGPGRASMLKGAGWKEPEKAKEPAPADASAAEAAAPAPDGAGGAEATPSA